MSGPDALLAARELVKEYVTGGAVTRALDAVSLDVPRGSFLSIMGPSGSGKSTLLHLLGGLDAPTSGEVLIGGRTMSSLADRELTLLRRKQIGFVFQFFNLVPVLTAEENIALPAVIKGLRPSAYGRRLEQIMDLVGIADCRGKLPSQISGGQQQRVAIARALFPSPDVLLADEPTGNLDSKTGLQILTILKNAQRKLGQTIVMVTHDHRNAAFGDEVVLLLDGRIGGRLTLDGKPKGGERRAEVVRTWLQKLGA